MGEYREVKGDLIYLALQGRFDVIAHGVSCFCRMRTGLAPKMADAFGCNTFELEDIRYRGDVNKLGQINYEDVHFKNDITNDPNKVIVVNAYTQFTFNKKDEENKLFDYSAWTLCARKMNILFKGLDIGLPMIGAGRAFGDWKIIRAIIEKELKDCNVTVVLYDK
jgi:O-acetyl-ADP-ribose deacetylase (regulator of RNase III)